MVTGKPVEEFKYKIDAESYWTIFAKAKESTASSPSGIHYGHYIAACQDDLPTAVNITFTRVCFLHGFALERWSASMHCVLQKKKLPYVDNLRVVQIFKIDFNFSFRYILGRKLLYHGNDHDINSNQIHGSRPGRSTHDTLTITTLTHDLA